MESTLPTNTKKPNNEELQTYDVLEFTVQKPISQFTILIHINFRIPNSGFTFLQPNLCQVRKQETKTKLFILIYLLTNVRDQIKTNIDALIYYVNFATKKQDYSF